MATELGLSEQWKKRQIDEYKNLAKSYLVG